MYDVCMGCGVVGVSGSIRGGKSHAYVWLPYVCPTILVLEIY